jgi:hypothetical protein
MPYTQDQFNTFGRSAGLAGIGAGIGGMFAGGGHDPYQAAAGYFDKIPSTIQPYFQPYINAGQQALPQLQSHYGNLLNDPTHMMNQIGAGYQQSPGYQFQMNQGMNAVNNAAAAGGMLGTPSHEFDAASMASGLANQDYYNYINHGLQQYQTGLAGTENLNQTGYNASDNLAGALANNLMTQGNMRFSGAAAQNQSQGSNWGNLLGGLGTLAAFF